MKEFFGNIVLTVVAMLIGFVCVQFTNQFNEVDSKLMQLKRNQEEMSRRLKKLEIPLPIIIQ